MSVQDNLDSDSYFAYFVIWQMGVSYQHGVHFHKQGTPMSDDVVTNTQLIILGQFFCSFLIMTLLQIY